jgi:hypothetical protein
VSNPQIVQAVRNSLSPNRIATYERAVVAVGDEGPAALDLYNWNAQISGAFLAPLHICEVVTRNTVSDALTAVYGARWPWSLGFERSLPSPSYGYNPRTDLLRIRAQQPTTGKVIPELKFVFWQTMFTRRYDLRLWNVHLRRVFPNLDPGKTVAQLRKEIYSDLEDVRLLRNRIAHHEPIFKRKLLNDLDKITALVRFRCQLTASWMIKSQWVTEYF